MKHYAERDIIGQGKFYAAHVEAMTAEALHSKSDIAAELAHRDVQIQELRRLLKYAAKYSGARHLMPDAWVEDVDLALAASNLEST